MASTTAVHDAALGSKPVNTSNQEPAQDPNVEPFRRLFNDTYPRLVAYARRRVAAADVDDLVAEVYSTAWRRRADVDLQSVDGSLLPWLYGVAGNAVRNVRRSADRQLRLVDRIGSQPVGAEQDPAERAGAELREALERLSFEDQELLRLVAWEGLSHAEVGQCLDCTTNAVGVRVQRARKRLQTELARLAAGPVPTEEY